MTKVTLTLAQALERGLVVREMTAWTNPTREMQRLEFGLGPVTRVAFPARIDDTDIQPAKTVMVHTEVIIEIPPGATIDVPKEFDRVIHRIHHGAIHGGAAPLLRRADGTSPPMAGPTLARPQPRSRTVAD